MALYIREIKGNLRSFVIWTVCIIAVMTVFLAMYPSFAAQGDAVQKMLEGFSPELIRMFGFDTLDFANTMDYYGYMLQYMLLATMIQFMLLGASLISKEEDAGTINFLYAKPISRRTIVGVKFLAGLTGIFAFFVVYTAAAGMLLLIFGKTGVDWGLVLLFSLALMLGQAMMLGVGMLLSMFITKARAVMSASIGVVMVLYMMSMIVSIKEGLSFLKYFIPFQYFDARQMLTSHSIDWVFVLLALAVAGAAYAASLYIFNRRDIRC